MYPQRAMAKVSLDEKEVVEDDQNVDQVLEAASVGSEDDESIEVTPPQQIESPSYSKLSPYM